jgi:hypothetical protein
MQYLGGHVKARKVFYNCRACTFSSEVGIYRPPLYVSGVILSAPPPMPKYSFPVKSIPQFLPDQSGPGTSPVSPTPSRKSQRGRNRGATGVTPLGDLRQHRPQRGQGVWEWSTASHCNQVDQLATAVARDHGQWHHARQLLLCRQGRRTRRW